MKVNKHQEGAVLYAEEGKDLFCTFNEMNYGSEVWLGYVYYDKDGNELEKPYLLTEKDFVEIDHVDTDINE